MKKAPHWLDNAASMLAIGLRVSDIAKTLGLSRQLVHYHLRSGNEKRRVTEVQREKNRLAARSAMRAKRALE